MNKKKKYTQNILLKKQTEEKRQKRKYRIDYLERDLRCLT